MSEYGAGGLEVRDQGHYLDQRFLHNIIMTPYLAAT